MRTISILFACVAILSTKCAADEEASVLNFDTEKIHMESITNIESQVVAANNLHLEGTNLVPGTFYGYVYYSKYGNKCQSSTMTSVIYKKANVCTAATIGNMMYEYRKFSCNIGGNFVMQKFADKNCSGVATNTYMLPLNTCPTSAGSPVYDCATDSTIMSKFKDVKGVVMKTYTASKGCQKDAFSALDTIYYATDSFTVESHNLFQCYSMDAIVCDGTKGIQQLHYSKANCKGTSKKTHSMALSTCQSYTSSSTNVTSYMTW
eukprot:CAMPEP_0170076652 /NCGR_PEP_ID=MMETSP0019_2-20121128/13619_1 /TAXON_ID=98059 /ORGANISM="Dinobryon sp., Strain UTEXLB2267" /LENGTH=262 /DNA_ID=CAMNT_0010288495 /DNA_START=28 /DNA_END=813 /DNA_ORIENTATION=-